MTLSGTLRIVLMFAVTSSPTAPSPRVAARVRRPFVYWRLIASPSIFSSQQYTTSPPTAARTRLSKARISASSNAFCRLSMGERWRTFANCSEATPPTRCVGESAVMRSGRSSSMRRRSRISASNSASEISGWSSTK